VRSMVSRLDSNLFCVSFMCVIYVHLYIEESLRGQIRLLVCRQPLFDCVHFDSSDPSTSPKVPVSLQFSSS
jgi:hypothetical protein